MTDERHYLYRDPAWVTSLLKGLIGLLLVGYVAAIVLMGLDYRLVLAVRTGAVADDLPAAYSTIQTYGTMLAGLSVLLALTLVAVMIVYLVWVYRSCANVRALGATDLRATPGFAVGMYFIPIYNFFAPLMVMNELYKASRNAINWKLERSSAIVPAWWAFQLISIIGNFLLQVNNRQHPPGVDGFKMLVATALIGFAMNIIFHILQYILVNNVSRLQTEQHKRNAGHAETFA